MNISIIIYTFLILGSVLAISSYIIYTVRCNKCGKTFPWGALYLESKIISEHKCEVKK